MDDIDRKILLAVQADGAAGLAEIAKVAGLSVSATAERQKRLEERGLIRGWHAALDPALSHHDRPTETRGVPQRSGAERGLLS